MKQKQRSTVQNSIASLPKQYNGLERFSGAVQLNKKTLQALNDQRTPVDKRDVLTFDTQKIYNHKHE